MRFPLSRTYVLVMLILVTVFTIPRPAHAAAYSISVNGRFSHLKIGLVIPSTPKWAHDVVLNASLAWNRAQVWYQQISSSERTVYTFVEANNGNAIVNFNMPRAYSGIAVGWTDYEYAPASKTIIVSTQTFLDPKVFNSSHENNATARRYAFWLALHELGHVLGLGSVLDSQDIMDPLWTTNRAAPMLSMLDIYAVCMLASGNALNFVTLPNGMQNKRFDARIFVLSYE